MRIESTNNPTLQAKPDGVLPMPRPASGSEPQAPAERDGQVVARTMPILGAAKTAPRFETLTPMTLTRRLTTVFANSFRLAFNLLSRSVLPSKNSVESGLDPIAQNRRQRDDVSPGSDRSANDRTAQPNSTERTSGGRGQQPETLLIETDTGGNERIKAVRSEQRHDPSAGQTGRPA